MPSVPDSFIEQGYKHFKITSDGLAKFDEMSDSGMSSSPLFQLLWILSQEFKSLLELKDDYIMLYQKYGFEKLKSIITRAVLDGYISMANVGEEYLDLTRAASYKSRIADLHNDDLEEILNTYIDYLEGRSNKIQIEGALKLIKAKLKDAPESVAKRKLLSRVNMPNPNIAFDSVISTLHTEGTAIGELFGMSNLEQEPVLKILDDLQSED